MSAIHAALIRLVGAVELAATIRGRMTGDEARALGQAHVALKSKMTPELALKIAQSAMAEAYASPCLDGHAELASTLDNALKVVSEALQ